MEEKKVFRIKHETTGVLILATVLILLGFASMFIIASMDAHHLVFVLTIFGIAVALCLIFYILEHILGTYIVIDSKYVTIWYFLRVKRIKIDDISYTVTEEYHRWRRKLAQEEYRMRLIFRMKDGHDFSVNDKATTVNGVFNWIFGFTEMRDKEDINAYKACVAINSIIKGE